MTAKRKKRILLIEEIRQWVNVVIGITLVIDFLLMFYACLLVNTMLFGVTSLVAMVLGPIWFATLLPFHFNFMEEYTRQQRKLKS